MVSFITYSKHTIKNNCCMKVGTVFASKIEVPRMFETQRSVDMTSSGKNGLNIRANASPKWDRTRCLKE